MAYIAEQRCTRMCACRGGNHFVLGGGVKGGQILGQCEHTRLHMHRHTHTRAHSCSRTHSRARTRPRARAGTRRRSTTTATAASAEARCPVPRCDRAVPRCNRAFPCCAPAATRRTRFRRRPAAPVIELGEPVEPGGAVVRAHPPSPCTARSLTRARLGWPVRSRSFARPSFFCVVILWFVPGSEWPMARCRRYYPTGPTSARRS